MRQRVVTSELFLKAQTDERLATLSGEGHTRAFAVLVERHRRVLLAHARGIVGSERSEDVLQQALLKAWRSLDQGIEVRHAQAWLHRIVHNTALSEIAHQPGNLDPLDENLAERGSAASVAEQRLEVRQVLEGLAGLPQHQRLALLGTELEGRSRRQLADELGLSEGAVRQLVHRARTRVRAGIAVLVPFPLVERAMRTSGWLSSSGAAAQWRPAAEVAGGSSVLAGGAVKLAAVVVAAGAVGGGALLRVEGGGHRQPLTHPSHRQPAASRVPTSSSAGPTTPGSAFLASRSSALHVAAVDAKAPGGTQAHRRDHSGTRGQQRPLVGGDSHPAEHSSGDAQPRHSDGTSTTSAKRAPTNDGSTKTDGGRTQTNGGGSTGDGSQTNSSDGGGTTTTVDSSSTTTTPQDTTSTTSGDSGGALTSTSGTTTTQPDSATTTTATTQTDSASTPTGGTTTDG